MKPVFKGLLLLSLLVANSAEAKIKIKNDALRDLYIREATVWEQPSWIDDKYKFSDELDILSGSKLPTMLSEYSKNEVYCIIDEEHAVKTTSGKTPKFFCQLLDTNSENIFYRVFKKNGEKQKIKVKYGVDNPEVFSEVVGTRLLWSLGFYADQVYLVDKVNCLGCSRDPFREKYIDKTTRIKPRVFSPTAIEKKISGEEIIYIGDNKKIKKSGWSIKELTQNKTQFDNKKYRSQLVRRDALRLLAALMGHSDTKNNNHRLICDSKRNNKGYCRGNIKMLIHDIGTSFGHTSLGSVVRTQRISKLELSRWKKRKVWSDAKNCIPKVGLLRSHASYYKKPITEEGRLFLAKLLKGFSSGDMGEKRVLDLFRSARIHLYGDSAEDWASVLLEKIEAVLYPMGKNRLSFKCPKSSN